MKRLLMVVVLAPLMLLADAWTDPATGVTWYYYDEGSEISVGGADPATGSLEIPSSINGKPVTLIVSEAFSGCSGLTSVTIPSGVKNIWSEAFYKCSGLRSVTIPSGVTSIGEYAFYACRSLRSVTIPSSVTRIEDGAFVACTSLASVYYLGNAPDSDRGWIYGTTPELVSYVPVDSVGWTTAASSGLPDSWYGQPIVHGGCLDVGGGVELQYRIERGKACIEMRPGCDARAVRGEVTIPSKIGGYDVAKIEANAFAGLQGMTSIVIPAGVRTIGSKAFADCDGLETITFLGDAPYVYDDAFSGTKSTLKFMVPPGSIGWSDTSLTQLPGVWKGHAIQRTGGGQDAGSANLGTVVVSNVVVHYVLNSVQPQFAISPSQDTGFVNIITEVKSCGVAAIPKSWAANYPDFVSKFGNDFTAALGKPTGKVGTGGTPQLVWQDYVAGTDPTKVDDVFSASITIVDGKVTVSHSPELDAERKALRKYTTWGKKSLLDATWTEVPLGRESEYNFFKVSVEMR